MWSAGSLFPPEHCRATFHERLDAFLHVFAAEDAILDLGNVIDRSLFTGLDIFQRGFLGHLNADRSVLGDQIRNLHCAGDLLAGSNDFLNKPVLAEELIARVKSLLRLKEFTDELETADSVLCTLGLIVEGRDPYTEGHCERLSVHAADLGRHLGMDEDSILALKRGGYLHDLGKIAVPDEILKKGSDLTPAEWAVMKLHPITGENICKPLHSLRLVLPIIRHHHEHSDGSGYPDGLIGPEIPVLPRVLQVVDVYDALRTARPYKDPLSHELAAQTMREEAARGLWDRELVAEYFSMLEQKRQVA